MHSTKLAALLSLLALSAACGDDDEPSTSVDDAGANASACTPGRRVACAGESGCEGTQLCAADGTFDACRCIDDSEAGGDDMVIDEPDAAEEPEDADTPDAGAAQDADAADSDAPASHLGEACDVLTQAPCALGERCTGHVGADGAVAAATCAPDTTLGLNAACEASGTSGEPIDQCARGLACNGERQCAPTCSVEVGCQGNYSCATYAGFFDDGLGICVPACDPLTQVRLTDNAPACGSANLGAPNRGCYSVGGYERLSFVCAPTSADTATRVHGELPRTNASGSPYANGCAPGHSPLLFAPGTTTVTCTAYCRPTPTYVGNAANADGIAPYDCQRLTGSATAECRYISHLFEAPDPTGRSDALGYCFDYARYSYDHDENPATANITQPSCTTRSSQPMSPGGIPEYLEWGCGPSTP